MPTDKKVLVIGDIMLDVYTEGTSSRLSPEAPVPVIIPHGKPKEMLGGAGNVCACLSKLGAKEVHLIGKIGSDAEGHKAVSLLGDIGVLFYMELSGITTVKHRILCNNQQVCRVDYEDMAEAKYSKEQLDNIYDIADGVDIILISDYAKGVVTKELMSRFSKRQRAKMVVDPKPVNKEYYKKVLLIKPNKGEIFLMSPAMHLIDSLEYLSKELSSPVVVTTSEGGCIAYSNDKVIHSMPPRVEMVNAIGAGDVFISALTIGYNGKIDKELLDFANKAAAISVQHPYTYCPTLQELME